MGVSFDESAIKNIT